MSTAVKRPAARAPGPSAASVGLPTALASWPADHVERWPLAKLVPYARNARTHTPEQIKQVAASMREWGWTVPVLVDEDGGIIAGHCRVSAGELNGYAEAPVMIARGWSDAKKRAYVLADNKLAMNAGWDDALLAAELSDLKTFEYDLSLTGFGGGELTNLLNPLDTDPAAEACPEAPEVPVSMAGDLWLLGPHRLLCGDSSRREDVERVMGGERADMLFTDPPYGVDFSGAKYNPRAKAWAGIANDQQGGATLCEFLTGVFGNAVAACVPAAPTYVWSASMQDGHEALRAMKAVDIHVQSQICWVKNALVLGQADYQWKHELCWYGWTKGEKHYWNGGRSLTTVWEEKRDASSTYVHPMQKPVALAIHAFKNSCREGGRVLDLFGGSGSTLIACEKMERNARLLELAPGFVDVIVKRWQTFTGREAKLDGGGTFADVTLERGGVPA